jgi:predicted DNA-binding protein
MSAMTSPKKPRKGSRHKPRRMVSLPPSLYERLAKVAAKSQRPINWEARLGIEHWVEGREKE